MKLSDKTIATATIVALATLPAIASAGTGIGVYDVKTVTAEFLMGVTPVATVAGASMSLLVVRRVWKIIRSSI